MMRELYVFQHLATLPGHEGSFKSHKKAFLNDPKCQKRGFLGLGLVDRLDISYYDKTKCFPAFGNSTMSRRIILKSLKSILKMFWTSGCWIDFILNILLELNVFQDLAMLPGPVLT